MNSTTLQQAIVWMGRAIGLNPTRDREEIVRYVNKYRNLLYNSFKEVQLFDDYEQCFALDTYHQDCHGAACAVYTGFTATLDMAGIMGAWESLEALTLRSKWREVHQGKGGSRGNKLTLTPVNGTFPTEHDMTSPQQVTLYASSKSDAGKVVNIRALGTDGTNHELLFKLNGDGQVTLNRTICKIIQVVLPPDLCGTVDLAQEDGRLLSSYPPGILVPKYKRYKVHQGFSCPSDTILVQSARTYLPVSEDHDVIEVGDELVIESAGRYFKYGENTTDSKERNASKSYLNDMFRYIKNIKDRDMGRSKQDSPTPAIPRPASRVRRRGLPGYRR